MSDGYNVKLDRCQYFEREWLTIDVKKAVAKKTDNCCAMCGKHIKLGDDDFTIDHFIPLNKGGSNKVENLIPLCHKCNQEKANLIISNYKRMNFLKSKYKLELMKITSNFMDSYIWLNSSNILKYDDEIIEISIPIQGNFKTRKNTRLHRKVNLRIKKEYEVTDEIIQFITDYNEKYNMGTEYIPSTLECYINNGMLYSVRNSSGKLVFVVYFNLINLWRDDKEPLKCIEIENIICPIDMNYDILNARLHLYSLVFNDIWDSVKALGLHTLNIAVQLNMDDERSGEILEFLSYSLTGRVHEETYFEVGKSDDEKFKSYMFQLYASDDSGKLSNDDILNMTEAELEKFSKQLEKRG